jgi:hypothetical protein
MINALFRKKATWLQSKCVELCIERFGIIGDTIFFRCLSCNQIVTAEQILEKGMCWCKGRRYKETNLTLREEFYWVGRSLLWKIFKKS